VFFEFDEPVFGICTWRSGEFRGTDVSSDVSSGMFQRIVSLIILSKRAKRDRPIPKLGGMIVEWLFIAFNYGHVIYLSSAGDNSFCCLACGLSRNTECFRSSLCRAGRALCNPLLLPLPPSLPPSLSQSLCPHIKFANKFAMTVLYMVDAACIKLIRKDKGGQRAESQRGSLQAGINE